MRPEVRKAIESRDDCDNLKRLTCKYNRFAGICEEPASEHGNEEKDEDVTVPEHYGRRHRMHYGLTEAILNVLTLGLFSRAEALTKHM